jgi:hypothetical protein
VGGPVAGPAGAGRAGGRVEGESSYMTEKKHDSVDFDFIAFLSDLAAPRLIDLTALLIEFN